MTDLEKYYETIKNGEVVVGYWLRKEIENLINDMHDPRYIYDTTEAQRRMKFQESMCLQSKAPFYMKPVNLMLWQRAFWEAVYSFKMADTGLRRFTEALLEIARKNFKTFTSGVIFIIGLLTEDKFGRFFSVAPDLSLSSELQVAIKKIIKSSPCLNDEKIFKLLRKEIRCRITESEYTPLAYSQDKMDGKMANMFLADECGAMDNYPLEAMRSSQITLDSPLGIVISTQYPNDDNAMLDEIDEAKKILDDLLD